MVLIRPKKKKKLRRKKLRRWLLRALVVLVALVVIASVVFSILLHSVRTHWNEFVSERLAADDPLTFAEIAAVRTEIAQEQNGAGVIEQAADQLDRLDESEITGVLTRDDACGWNFLEGIHEKCIEPTRRYVQARRAALDELSRLRDFAEIRFDGPYQENILARSSSMLAKITAVRSLVKLIHLDVLLNIIDGENEAAVERLMLQLRLSQALFQEPALVFSLVGFACDHLAVKSVELLLRTRTPDGPALLRLQRQWQRSLRFRTMTHVLRGERASFLNMVDVDAILREWPGLAAKTSFNPLHWIPFLEDWYFESNRLQGATVFTRLIDASDDPVSLSAVAHSERERVSAFSPEQTFVRILLPGFARSVVLHVRTLAFFRCGFTVLAAERFRLRQGRFPASVEELVPDELEEVPIDPFDGQPMRLASDDEGIVVYSIGENAVDDGGQIVPAKGEHPGRDFGLRLIPPDRRKLILLRDETTAEK